MNRRKTLFVVFIAFFSLAALAVIWIIEPDKDMMIDAFLAFDRVYLLIAFLAMALYLCVDSVNIWYMARKIANKKISLGYCIKVSIIGKTYCAITPFGSAGQPYYVIAIANKGINASAGSSFVVVKYLVHQAVYILFGIAAIFITRRSIALGSLVWAFVAFGFLVSILLPLSAVLFSSNKAFMHKVFMFIGKYGIKLRLMKKTEDLENRVQTLVHNYRDGIKMLIRKPSMLIVIAVITIIELMLFVSIPYLVRLGFGTPDYGFIS
ncbi:MAG TPA: flippase-like domain-containing protein, partial [Clostridia bacterium]|nr:flippase-like domain-containing protein [Clostridia bacterium]